MVVKQESKIVAKPVNAQNENSSGLTAKFFTRMFTKNNLELSSGKTVNSINKEDFVPKNEKRDRDLIEAD